MGRWLALFLALTCVARADEYPNGRVSRHARYVKDTVQTDLSFIKGQQVPGVHVKRDRHTHRTDFHFWRGHWHIMLSIDHPPDELTSGARYAVPLKVTVVKEGDDPMAYRATATTYGMHRARVAVKPSRVTKPRRGAEAEVVQGELAFTPRFDWDADEIGIEVAFTDGAGTDWAVARYAWWQNLTERHRTPRRRDLDVEKP